MKNLNLAREFVHRLKNTCYSHTTIQVINALAQNTNQENMCYYGGHLSLLRQTHLGVSTLNKHLRILREDGLIQPQFKKGELYKSQKRQNYKLILPPEGFDTCREWPVHNQTSLHLDSWQECFTRLLWLRDEEERLLGRRTAEKPESNFSAPPIEDSPEEDMPW
jgi:hypothetical protein